MIIMEDAMHDILTTVNNGIVFSRRYFAHIFHQAKDPRPPPAAVTPAAEATAGFTPPPPLLGWLCPLIPLFPTAALLGPPLAFGWPELEPTEAVEDNV